MSMFPSAHATVYYNEAGEPIGWSDESYSEPDGYDDYQAANDRGWRVKCPSCNTGIGYSDDLEAQDLLRHNETCAGPWVGDTPPGFPPETIQEYP